MTVLGLSAFLAVKGTAFAEKLDLGQIPKSVVQDFCNSHGGTYGDFGDNGSVCLTGGGNSIYCDKNSNCTGYTKDASVQGNLLFPRAGSVLQNAPATPAPPKTLTPKGPTTGGTNKQ